MIDHSQDNSQAYQKRRLDSGSGERAPLLRALDDLGATVTRVEELRDELACRLGSITPPSPVQNLPAAPVDRPGASLIVGSVVDYTERLHHINNTLAELLELLEL